jgi:hypothetical protein
MLYKISFTEPRFNDNTEELTLLKNFEAHWTDSLCLKTGKSRET